MMTVDMSTFEDLLAAGPNSGLADEVEGWLHDPNRTAHRLVTLPTAALMEQALGVTPPAGTLQDGMHLPGGLWRVLPDPLLALHPGRWANRMGRLRIPVATHLDLTAQLLEEWGWTTCGRNRSRTGARCILGAQYALYRLGYGTQDTATEAARHIQGALANRGVTESYPVWNDRQTSREQVIALVREAARGVS